jgi:hypothetical protein
VNSAFWAHLASVYRAGESAAIANCAHGPELAAFAARQRAGEYSAMAGQCDLLADSARRAEAGKAEPASLRELGLS